MNVHLELLCWMLLCGGLWLAAACAAYAFLKVLHAIRMEKLRQKLLASRRVHNRFCAKVHTNGYVVRLINNVPWKEENKGREQGHDA